MAADTDIVTADPFGLAEKASSLSLKGGGLLASLAAFGIYMENEHNWQINDAHITIALIGALLMGLVAWAVVPIVDILCRTFLTNRLMKTSGTNNATVNNQVAEMVQNPLVNLQLATLDVPGEDRSRRVMLLGEVRKPED